MSNINRVVLTGNLTADPEIKESGSGVSIGRLRIANNTRKKEDGEWVDAPNFFNVTTFGGQAENCEKYLSKGSSVAIDGRLEWREWETDDGDRRSAVSIVADNVQFLSSGGGQASQAEEEDGSDDDEDIPF